MTSTILQGPDLAALLPLEVVGLTAFVVLLAIAFRRNHGAAAALTLAGLAIAFARVILAAGAAPREIGTLLVVDSYALTYQGLLLLASAAVTLLAYGYFRSTGEEREEFYVLLLISTFGGMVLTESAHFASLFLGLEILSVPLYALIAYNRLGENGVEAGLKYLVLAGSSAAFMLFGIALIYAETGVLQFALLASAPAPAGSLLSLAGFALVVVGFGFKLAVVPFHLWTPDVYQGAPAPATALIATVSKGAMFAVLFRLFHQAGAMSPQLTLIFVLVALASMIAGNVLALRQTNVKRILAYSSISHLGYVLVAFLAGGALGAAAATFYFVAYFAMTLVAFGVVSALSTAEHEAETIDEYRGLAWRRPWLAAALTGALLSLAGIPLTAGFVGKFLLVTAGVGSAEWLLVVTLVVTSAIGLVYYLRVVTALFAPAEAAPVPPLLAWPTGVTIAVLALVILWLGLYPTPVVDLIRAGVASVAG